MYHPALLKGPVFTGEYLPYFYHSGKFLQYDMPPQAGSVGLNHGYSTYDFTSDILRRRQYPHRQMTVEDIIQDGYFSVSAAEPEMALISDKAQTTKLGLSDIIQQVRSRYEIYETNMYQIELGKCYTLSAVFGLIASRGGVRMDGREVYSLDKRLQEFYEQQRDERVRLWQDISKLRQLLPEQAQSYLSAHRKLSILQDYDGDAP